MGKSRILWVSLPVLLLTSVPAMATERSISAVPTAWRLQNYIPNHVVAWFTGVAGCSNGGLTMPANSTNEDRDRFWSLIMTAKAANKIVFVYYDDVTCQIASFGWHEGN